MTVLVPRRPKRLPALVGRLLPLAFVASCAGDDGSVTILIEAEESITNGLVAGSSPEDIVDGWSATFDTYVVGLSNVRLARSTSSKEAIDRTVRLIDLRSLPASGAIVTQLDGLAEGRWDLFSYDVVVPTDEAVVDPTIAPADVARMKAEACTLLIRGTITKPDGESCPPHLACRPATSIRFDLCLPDVVSYVSCTSETGLPGIPIAASRTSSAAITFHGDHLFFDAFPGGAEVVMRRAQWIANADLDGDGTVGRTELESIRAATGDLSLLLPPSEFSLTGSPIVPLSDAFTYARAQVASQGHFQGEGECARDVR